MNEVIKLGNDRIKESKFISLVEENAKWIASKQKTKSRSLNYSELKRNEKIDKDYLSKFDEIKNYKNNLEFEFISNNENQFQEIEEIIERRNIWINALKSDFQLNEGLNILDNLRSNANLKNPTIANKI